jgi:hypothetical protein
MIITTLLLPLGHIPFKELGDHQVEEVEPGEKTQTSGELPAVDRVCAPAHRRPLELGHPNNLSLDLGLNEDPPVSPLSLMFRIYLPVSCCCF